MSRDQTVFIDDNGKAYQFYSSENNATLYISELTDDYLKPTGRYTRNFVKQSREAPAVFKYNGKYYMLSSGCTGWDQCCRAGCSRLHHGAMDYHRQSMYRS